MSQFFDLDYASALDFYQLTQAQAYWESGRAHDKGCFYFSFRENPFKGGFALASGLTHLSHMIEHFEFTPELIEFLASQVSPDASPLFKEEFLQYLRHLRLSLDIDALPEGSLVFAHEPLLRVTGSLMEAQLIEALLLNTVSFETLIATKAARICLAAQVPVAEFGLRRAQGLAGALYASRAAAVGGCSSTSHVLAARQFGLKLVGTHAHSWVMAFDSELEAFRSYAQLNPNNCTLLIDTYDALQGLENALIVAGEMRAQGHELAGVRIDSGDLAWLSKRVRERLNQAGFPKVKIILSNDLDEYTIKSIKEQGACVDAFGVGTKLVTAADQPSLGGVYKLSAVQLAGAQTWKLCLKVSNQRGKLSIPGLLNVRRYFFEDGRLAGDMVYDENFDINEHQVIVDPLDSLRQKTLKGLSFKTLFKPLVRNGKSVLQPQETFVQTAAAYAQEQLALLDESQKRTLNPHTYPVGLERGLFKRQHKLSAQLLGLEEAQDLQGEQPC